MTTSTQLIAQLRFDPQNSCYTCEGHWSILTLDNVLNYFKESSLPISKKLIINGKKIGKFDSAGALTLIRCIEKLKKLDNSIEYVDFNKQQLNLIKLVESKRANLSYLPPTPKKSGFLYNIGKETIEKLKQFDGLITLIGDLSEKLFTAFRTYRLLPFPSIIANIHTAGITALPIIALLSFLIGVVLAYQMGLQLETYGANIFIAYLSGMAIFREFAPLITAIIIAGRTSSAFTAQIGSMVINEEIDALNTMGLSATELLVVPKTLGLFLVFPLLIFWSDIFGILGSAIMSKFMLNISYIDFMRRLQDSVGLKQLLLGLYKAPAFSILIALVGCFQGFRVKANAASIGTQTTKSVVQALFLIIIADAIYSVIYSWLDI